LVEVGVAEGANAKMILQEWPFDKGLHLTLVDNQEVFSQLVEHVLREFGADRDHRCIVGASAEVAATFPDEHFDMVYLDDDHELEGVRRSIAAWKPKVKVGGVLGGHDWPNEAGVAPAVAELIAETGWSLCVSEWDWWCVKVQLG
jgi:predicted O-methyltransferase YrrM